MDYKATLHRYLRSRRSGLVATLDGLSEYDVRRPMTPTGTNLLGLVKHVASVQAEYFGEVFDRPSGLYLPWMGENVEEDADLWVTAQESRAGVVELYRSSAAHSDATIEALGLEARGRVLWWPPERQEVTLHQVLVHMCVETAQHLGHAQILRELVAAEVGRAPGGAGVTERSLQEWTEHRARLEVAARQAQTRSVEPAAEDQRSQ